VPEVARFSPNCILIIVTNPLDNMVKLAYEISGLPKERVIGMAGVLDSARFKTFVAMETDASVRDIEAMVLGGHGDLMVPVLGSCTVKNVPVEQILPKEKLDEIIYRTQNGGGEIVNLLKTGSAFFAPALSIVEMMEAILFDTKKVLPCSVYLSGEYGESGVFAGVPVSLGRAGAERIMEIPLSEEEKIAFKQSVEHIKTIA
jgi:malate dehydrogenase